MTTVELGARSAHDRRSAATSRSAPRPEGQLLAALDVVAVTLVYLFVRPRLVDLLLVGFVLFSSFLSGAYRRPRVALSALADMKATIVAASGPLVVAGVGAGFGLLSLDTVRFAALLIPGIAVGRVVAYRSIRALRRRGRFIHRGIVVGSGQVAGRLIEVLAARPEMGIDVVGHVDDLEPGDSFDAMWLGPVAGLADSVAQTGATRVIAAYSRIRDDELAERLRDLKSTGAEVFVVPRLFEFGSSAGDMRTQSVGEIPMVWLPHREWRREQLWLKRSFDLVLSSGALIVLSPVLLLTALAIRLTSRGPILFRQVRLGQDERPFTMYKFRSMRVAGGDEMRQSGGGDPRITKVGAVIRRLSVDELPQLINVVTGDMSIVGPRPEQPYFVQTNDGVPGYRTRHRLQVGLTGWSQVNRLRGADTSLHDRARYDNYYIEHWSIWLDTVIVIRTAVAALRGS